MTAGGERRAASATRRIVVRGRVQGVWFRDSMVEAVHALPAGSRLAGYVRNLDDGSVEAWLQGDDESVAAMIAWATRGPPRARVDEVEVEDAVADPAFREFTRR